MFNVTIKYPDGAVLRATVTRAALKGFKLSSCKGAAVSIVKVRS
jgi:molybdopterin-binding protein